MRMNGVLISASVANVLYPLLFSVCTLVCVALFVWLMVRSIGKTNGEEATAGGRQLNFTALMLALLLIGLVLRLIFVFLVKGYRPDVNVAISLFDRLKRDGFAKNYYVDAGMDMFPLTYYIYALMGLFYNLGLTPVSTLTPLLVKLPLIAADLITAVVLWKLARKYMNETVALVVCGLVCVFPVFVFASSVWATTYCVLMMFSVLALYFLVRKNHVALIGVYSAALLCHMHAIYLFPLVAVFVIYHFVKAILKIRADKPSSFGDVLANPEMRPVFTVPVSIVGFTVLSYLVALPLLIGSFGAGFFTFIYRIYLRPLVSFSLFGHNSLGIFNLFMRNGRSLDTRFPSVVFAVLFAVIITGIVLLVYLSKKNRANLVYLAAYVGLTLATYFVGFDEFSLLATLAVLLMSFLLVRDKRILSVFGVLSVIVAINASTVMAYAGYYNLLPDSSFNGVNLSNTVLSGGISAVTIVCSALAVLAHLYATVVLLDISMSNKRKLLPYESNAGFTCAMSQFFRIKTK